MPEMKYYTVTRTQTVTVVANDTKGAALVADAMFEGDGNMYHFDSTRDLPEGVWGNPRSGVETVETRVTKNR